MPPDGEDVPEETLWAIATDCNSMRRDMTSSLRACLAAESWKRLWPDGQTGKGARTDIKPKDKNILTFEVFAKQSFKVSETYAKQALAILLIEVAGTMAARWDRIVATLPAFGRCRWT